jgi:small subunit ribosomal protein S11e
VSSRSALSRSRYYRRPTTATPSANANALRQPHIFQNHKAGGPRKNTRTRRWHKDVGLGFRTPKTAIEGTYIDKKCPFTGMVSIRGRILTGTVMSTKMHRT